MRKTYRNDITGKEIEVIGDKVQNPSPLDPAGTYSNVYTGEKIDVSWGVARPVQPESTYAVSSGWGLALVAVVLGVFGYAIGKEYLRDKKIEEMKEYTRLGRIIHVEQNRKYKGQTKCVVSSDKAIVYQFVVDPDAYREIGNFKKGSVLSFEEAIGHWIVVSIPVVGKNGKERMTRGYVRYSDLDVLKDDVKNDSRKNVESKKGRACLGFDRTVACLDSMGFEAVAGDVVRVKYVGKPVRGTGVKMSAGRVSTLEG